MEINLYPENERFAEGAYYDQMFLWGPEYYNKSQEGHADVNAVPSDENMPGKSDEKGAEEGGKVAAEEEAEE